MNKTLYPNEQMPQIEVEQGDMNDPMLDNELQNLMMQQQNPMGMGNGWITKDTQINDKILSSHNKYKKIVRIIPKIEEVKVGIPVLDSKGLIVYRELENPEGEMIKVPVLRKIRTIKFVTGYEVQEHDFPIPEWFSDSVTSSSLDNMEARFIRMVDNMAINLTMRTLTNPNANFTGFLNRLYFLKASIADSAKGVGGRAMEMSKTTISKGESQVSMYRKNAMDDEFEQKKKKGLFHLGWWIF